VLKLLADDEWRRESAAKEITGDGEGLILNLFGGFDVSYKQERHHLSLYI
jgi:hypothetical protein